MQTAGITVPNPTSVYRPPERAYLMHYSWNIARRNHDPSTVPAYNGVEICWVHRNDTGAVDRTASSNAAENMVTAYGIVRQPALTSRHTIRQAFDITLSWAGDIDIVDARGTTVTINTAPRNGLNAQLRAVGATYGVIAGPADDPPHWSTDGR